MKALQTLTVARERIPASVEHRHTDLGPYEVHTPEHWRLRITTQPVATPTEQT
jgi:hypothetical protein